MDNTDLFDYHIRLNSPDDDYPATGPSGQSNYCMLLEWLEKNSPGRYALCIEERQTDKAHIHAFATITKLHSRKLRELFRKNILPTAKNKRPYSVAKRRGNLLAYMMKDISDCICDIIQDYKPGQGYGFRIPSPNHPQMLYGLQLVDEDLPDFYAHGFTQNELMEAYEKSYAKPKIPKENWSQIRSLAIQNWKEQDFSNGSNATVQNDFIDMLVSLHIHHNRTPPRQTLVNFWLLKLGLISVQQYRHKKYTDFFPDYISWHKS